MQRRSLSHGTRLVALLAGLGMCDACSKPPPDPVVIENRRVLVRNQTDEDWTDVRVSINRYYHAGAQRLAATGRLEVNLDAFVSGYGQRFDFARRQITDLRVKAKRPNGEPIELVKDFKASGLDGVFGKDK